MDSLPLVNGDPAAGGGAFPWRWRCGIEDLFPGRPAVYLGAPATIFLACRRPVKGATREGVAEDRRKTTIYFANESAGPQRGGYLPRMIIFFDLVLLSEGRGRGRYFSPAIAYLVKKCWIITSPESSTQPVCSSHGTIHPPRSWGTRDAPCRTR